jgi:hypothetical protein
MPSFFRPALSKNPVLLRSTARSVTPFGGLVSLVESTGDRHFWEDAQTAFHPLFRINRCAAAKIENG